jgi:hypothetical protein
MENKESPASGVHLPPRAGAQQAAGSTAASGTTKPLGARQRVSLSPHSPLSPKVVPKDAKDLVKDLASRISSSSQVPPPSGTRSPSGSRRLPTSEQQEDEDSLEEGEEGLSGEGTDVLRLEAFCGGGQRGHPHTAPLPQTHCEPQAQASTRTAMGSHRQNLMSRTSQHLRKSRAQPRCLVWGRGQASGWAPTPYQPLPT